MTSLIPHDSSFTDSSASENTGILANHSQHDHNTNDQLDDDTIHDLNVSSSLHHSKKTRYIILVFFASLTLSLIILAIVISYQTNTVEPTAVDSDPFVLQFSQQVDSIVHKVNSMGNDMKERLEYLSDTFGPRLAGTENLENLIDWIRLVAINDNLQKVTKEPVMVPVWRQFDNFTCFMTTNDPVTNTTSTMPLSMLPLGRSISTPLQGLTAPIIIVKSFQELDILNTSVAGKIVIYNVAWPTNLSPMEAYSQLYQYRGNGASNAAKYGAVATFVRSLTPSSYTLPHTGGMQYASNITKIPSAALSVSHVLQLQRLIDRGQSVNITFTMITETLSDAQSYNVMGEITGTTHPEQVIVIGGHTDSWFVGRGSVDDGAGFLVSWYAVKAILELDLKPKRTIRFVGFTNEESGARGGAQYAIDHQNETTLLAVECDSGVFTPIIGFSINGPSNVVETLQKTIPLFPFKIKIESGSGGTDVTPLRDNGGSVGELLVDTTDYFEYHHSIHDIPSVISNQDLIDSTTSLAILSFIVADMDTPLPID